MTKKKFLFLLLTYRSPWRIQVVGCQKVRSSILLWFLIYRLAAVFPQADGSKINKTKTNLRGQWNKFSAQKQLLPVVVIIIMIMAMSPLPTAFITLVSIMSRTFSSESVEALDCFSRCFCCCRRHFCIFRPINIFFPFLSVAQEEKALRPSLKSNQKVVFFLIFSFFLSLMKWNEKRIKRFVDGKPPTVPAVENFSKQSRSGQKQSAKKQQVSFFPIFNLLRLF